MNESGVLRSRFGRRVNARLADGGMSAAELARSIDLPIARVDDILAGTYAPIRLREMELIARAIDTSVYDLLSP